MKVQNYGRAAVVVLVTVLIVSIAACADRGTTRTTGETVDDATITTKVKAALIEDPDVKALQINVNTYNGVVQLNGFVDRSEQITKAGQIARGVKGVKSVQNNLSVKAPTPK